MAEVKNLQPSKQPIEDIALMTYTGQDPQRRLYHQGYEQYLEEMPVLDDKDPFLEEKVQMTANLMDKLADQLLADGWVKQDLPAPEGFKRTIIGLEKPVTECMGFAKSKVVVKE